MRTYEVTTTSRTFHVKAASMEAALRLANLCEADGEETLMLFDGHDHFVVSLIQTITIEA